MARKRSTHTRPLVIHYRRHQRRPLTGLIIAVAVLIAAAAVAWQGPNLNIVLPDVAPTVTITTTITPEPEPSPSLTPPQATPGSVLEEGHDYSFMDVIDGKPARWACDTPIRVATSGDVPAGTQPALEEVIKTLREVSNLPLSVTTPNLAADITIHYVAPGTTIGHITLDGGDRLGEAGPTVTNRQITSGTVLLRNDRPTTDPTSPDGKSVLMHELIHTLGLSHAHESTDELMTPTHAPGTGPQLGAGDRAGLELLGCP